MLFQHLVETLTELNAPLVLDMFLSPKNKGHQTASDVLAGVAEVPGK